MRVLLLFSGGIDSTTLLASLSRANDVLCVFYDYGQPQAEQERHVTVRLAAKYNAQLVTERVPLPEAKGVTYPNRNAVLLSLAAAKAHHLGVAQVFYGATKDDAKRFPDCTAAFVDAFNLVLREAGLDVTVQAPWVNLSKADVMVKATLYDVDLTQTWSCYRGGATQCGECLACKARGPAA